MKAMIFVSSGYGEFSSRAVEPIFHSLFVMGINKKGETSDRCTPWRVAAVDSPYFWGVVWFVSVRYSVEHTQKGL